MTRMSLLKLTTNLVVVLSLGACASDYVGHTDRIAYSHGNAVRANMAIQTINPSKPSMYKTGGLGKNGPVIVSATPAP
ncbi:MAG: hypothetical protein ABIQ30_11245 [Devosia sp.]